MIWEQAKSIRVKYCNGSQIFPMGTLALQDRTIFFEYDPDFLILGLELSPFKLRSTKPTQIWP